jgi:16S rRNA (guanine(966)-N(2))-methyltransferase RsmD
MRVAGGVNRGRRLRYPRVGTVGRQAGQRPTRNIVKQAIFNILRSRLGGARVADLFCGAGALGIEALSAGAASAIFVERDRRTLSRLKENLLPFAGRARVIAGDVSRVLPRLAGEQFDIILADPPYQRGQDTETLKLIARYGLLKPDGVVVLEHSRRDQPVIPAELELTGAHKYGDTIVSTIRNAECRIRNSAICIPPSALKSGGTT